MKCSIGIPGFHYTNTNFQHLSLLAVVFFIFFSFESLILRSPRPLSLFVLFQTTAVLQLRPPTHGAGGAIRPRVVTRGGSFRSIQRAAHRLGSAGDLNVLNSASDACVFGISDSVCLESDRRQSDGSRSVF